MWEAKALLLPRSEAEVVVVLASCFRPTAIHIEKTSESLRGPFNQASFSLKTKYI